MNFKTMFQTGYFQTKINNWEQKKVELFKLLDSRKLEFVQTNNSTYYPFNQDNELLLIQVNQINQEKYFHLISNQSLDKTSKLQ